eukprot:TRINITY_DN28161_c0_g1_i1.p1 TRINITY_DN28161_c0_g1~~TRINITY_DN28161_c0_g1_i1.p1  ORF type:complete len:492 (+),score=111.50 TRINITY_DN28161_c0_g1_i1:67-1542(+)
MTCYIVAGKADDPSFARAEYAAKQIQAACPGVFFRFEMKHPDAWKEFINDVYKKYDFRNYPEDFAGPLVWTHEGDLIGGSAEFVQKICVAKFGMESIPSVTDAIFKHISAENLKQVKHELQRRAAGPPFSEHLEDLESKAQSQGFLAMRRFDSKKTFVKSGASLEVWVSDSELKEEKQRIRQEIAAAEGKQAPESVPGGCCVGTVGADQTHTVMLHPRPLVRKHMVLPKRRCVEEIFPEGSDEVRELRVPPCAFREDADEDLFVEDFSAAMETMLSVGGVAVWTGLRKGGAEYRSPLDTHLQVLPFPVHSEGDDCPRRFPLDLHVDRALKEAATALPVFGFRHMLLPITPQGDGKSKIAELAQAGFAAYEAARGKERGSCMLAFTTSWLLLVPLADPPEAASLNYDAWLRMPPPPPCALIGIFIVDAIARDFPATAGDSGHDGVFVSNRAALEDIPEGSPEYEAARLEARINVAILDHPTEMIAHWVRPCN